MKRLQFIACAAAILFIVHLPSATRAQEPKPEAKPQTQVVNFSKLLPFLPEPPAGWKAEKPDGSTTQSEGFSLTTAGRTYTQGEAEEAPTVTINILDSGNNKAFSDATTAAWNASQETTDGYAKSVSIDGNRGYEQFTKDGQVGNLWVVVGGRFFVQVETTRLPASEMQAWLKKLDLKKLATLK